MRLIEQALVPRCEYGPVLDAIVKTERWTGVVDQSTPKDPNEPLLIPTVLKAAESLDDAGYVSAQEVVEEISRVVASSQTGDNRPCVTLALIDGRQRRVIRVGDCHVAIGDSRFPGKNRVDQVLGPMRSLVNELHGIDPTAPSGGDPGRLAILPWLGQAAKLLRNHPSSRFGFGAVDGGPVPLRFVEEFPVGSDSTIVAVSTDGYLGADLRLADAEATLLAYLKREEQLDLNQTKGRSPGAASFDDRAFVSVRFECSG